MYEEDGKEEMKELSKKYESESKNLSTSEAATRYDEEETSTSGSQEPNEEQGDSFRRSKNGFRKHRGNHTNFVSKCFYDEVNDSDNEKDSKNNLHPSEENGSFDVSGRSDDEHGSFYGIDPFPMTSDEEIERYDKDEESETSSKEEEEVDLEGKLICALKEIKSLKKENEEQKLHSQKEIDR